jgi:hypothetical protein
MPKLRMLIVFVLVLAGLQVRNSAAAPISVYDNFGTGDAYDTSEGWAVTGPTATFSNRFNNIEAAMSFSPSQDCSLFAVALAVSLSGSGTNSITVTLADNDSGVPGAAIETFQFDGAMGQFNNDNTPLQADSVANPILDSDQTYWLVVSATGDTYAYWNDSLSDTSGGANQNLSNAPSGWNWSFYSGDTTAAFSITGTALAPAPEPASIAFFSTGTLAVIGFYLARKRRSAKRPG